MKFFLLLSTVFLTGACYCAPSNSKGNGGNATQDSGDETPVSQVQRVTQQIPQEKQTVPSTNVGAPTPVPLHNRSTKELAVPITLDLAKVDTNSVDVPATTVRDGINTTYYYPKGKFYFEKIVDEAKTVWESTEKKCSPAYTISKGNVTFLALLLKKSDDETDLIYYEKKNLGWKLVEKTKSENIIEELKRQPEQPAVKTIDLDLSDVDSTAFSVEESEEDKVPIKKYAVKTDHHLNEINDGDFELWKSESPNKHCTLATVYFEGENPMLLSLTLNQGFVYLKKNGKWVGVSKDDCDVALTEMKRLASLPKARTVELDIADIDGNAFTVKEEALEGVPLKTVTPKDGVLITSVMDGEKEVWKGADKEHALQVLVCYDGESPVSVVVNFVKADGKNVWRYHNLKENEWSVVKKEDCENLLEELKKEVSTELPKDVSTVQSAEQDGLVLDLASPNSSQCKSFDYNFAGNAVQLIVPNKGTTVSTLMNGTEDVHALSAGETLQYANLYLNKDGTPELILVTLKTSSGISRRDYVKEEGEWTVCNNIDAKMRSLRTSTTFKSNFTMDIALANSTKECSVFEVDLLGITIRHFFPKPGHLVIGVKDGDKELWTPSKDLDNCLSCLVYKKGSMELLEITLVEGGSVGKKYFEKLDGKWNNITQGDLLNKLQEMRKSVSSPNPSTTPSQ
ncbi:signal peptide containing protein [Theileria equi strain WA]|uniref:Signal peptide containing protein n=1 Tax=Theileria equi strain WA TaxID=1537102 RepID=L1LAX1_THEEQ|nr:signal peptide containing protein [Theileria equi strain WA]EKX72414.1 signal peptide containing protein [Theileria equi strain WA]|eukprot:XP_004831866.1 signal peptide containing protein [Theileria equi strain WA]